MIGWKAVLKFTGLFLLSYILLIIPQTGINKLYAEFLCSTGNKLYHDFSNKGVVILSTQEGKNDISLFISNTSLRTKEGNITGAKYNEASDLIGYFYTAFFLALVIATPLSWKRKLIALVVGFILITIFVMIILRIIILHNFSLNAMVNLYQDAASKASIDFWYNYFGAAMTLGYSFVVIVWLGVSIGKNEWRKLNGALTDIISKNKSGKQNKTAPNKKIKINK